MHGLIFETSIWLLAGSTRYLASRLRRNSRTKQEATPETRVQSVRRRIFSDFSTNSSKAVRQPTTLPVRQFCYQRSVKRERKTRGERSPPWSYKGVCCISALGVFSRSQAGSTAVPRASALRRYPGRSRALELWPIGLRSPTRRRENVRV